jgi:Rrf2 family protein
MRALLELVALSRAEPARPVTAETLAARQEIPLKFLEAILRDLRQAQILVAQRGPGGGYRLGRPAEEITVGDVVRVIDGPLAAVRGQRPELVGYTGAATPLQQVWIATRAALRRVLDQVTLHDLAEGQLPPQVRDLLEDAHAWGRPGR